MIDLPQVVEAVRDPLVVVLGLFVFGVLATYLLFRRHSVGRAGVRVAFLILLTFALVRVDVVPYLPLQLTGSPPSGSSDSTVSSTGPCPPSQYEPSTHRYVFKLYALNSELPLQAGVSMTDVEKAMQGHITGHAMLTGLSRK